MSIYVDELVNWGTKGWWCHMMTDGELEELHQFAQSIGMKRAWFQPKSHPHYDLRPSKRVAAIAKGANAVSSREMVRRCIHYS
jgi:hypothetical protein